MYKVITLILSVIIVLFLIKSALRISSKLSDPIPINGLEPPPSTHYGGIILDSNTESKKPILLEGMKVSTLRLTLGDLKKTRTPFIVQTKDGYFLIVEEFGEACDEDKVLISDPRYGKVLLKNNHFQKICGSFVLTVVE